MSFRKRRLPCFSNPFLPIFSILALLVTIAPAYSQEVIYSGNHYDDFTTETYIEGNSKRKPPEMKKIMVVHESGTPVSCGASLTIDYGNLPAHKTPMIVSAAGTNKAEDAILSDNTLNLKNGDVKGFLHAATGWHGSAVNNTLNISGGSSKFRNMGAGLTKGMAQNNTVNITGGDIMNHSYGARLIEEGEVSHNKVNVTGGKFSSRNGLNLEGAVVGKAKKGGTFISHAHHNSVFISGNATFENTVSIFGGRSAQLSEFNSVEIKGTPELKFKKETVVCGGEAALNRSATPEQHAKALHNHVSIHGSGIALSRVYGGKINWGSTDNNEITFQSPLSTEKDAIEVEKIMAGGFAKFSACGNTVTVRGGKIGSGENPASSDETKKGMYLVGGSVGDIAQGGGSIGQCKAHNNTVNLSGKISFGNSTGDAFALAGGHHHGLPTQRVRPSGDPRLFKGNSLNIAPDFEMKGHIDTLANFEYINFSLPADAADTLVNKDHDILHVGEADLTDGASNSTKFCVSKIENGGKLLKKDDRIHLLRAENSLKNLSGNTEISSNTATGENGYLAQNTTLHKCSIEINPDAKKVDLTIDDSATINCSEPQVAFIGAIAEREPFSVMSADAPRRNGRFGFADMSGEILTRETGSQIKYHGSAFTAGYASKQDSVTQGIFIEGGYSTYDTSGAVLDLPLTGEGSLKTIGGGYAIHIEGNSGRYLETAIRGGFGKNKWTPGFPFSCMAVDYSSRYWGGILGAGQTFTLKNGDEITCYGRFALTRTSGEDFILADSPYHFKPVTSKNLKLGFRHQLNRAGWSPYFGLAWQYEFAGTSETEIAGISTGGAKSLRGGTIIEEFGLHFTPEKSGLPEINIGLSGYQGKTSGADGFLNLKFSF